MHKTHVVSSEESKPEQPESDVNSVAKSADQPSSVGENDIAWPVPVAAMYPLATALSGLMVWAFGLDWVLVSLIPFVIFLSAMTVIDLRELRIPDRLTKPAAMAVVPLLALGLLSDWNGISLVRALVGALAMGAFYFILFFIYPAGMGFGDVKLAPIIGAQLGFSVVPTQRLAFRLAPSWLQAPSLPLFSMPAATEEPANWWRRRVRCNERARNLLLGRASLTESLYEEKT